MRPGGTEQVHIGWRKLPRIRFADVMDIAVTELRCVKVLDHPRCHVVTSVSRVYGIRPDGRGVACASARLAMPRNIPRAMT